MVFQPAPSTPGIPSEISPTKQRVVTKLLAVQPNLVKTSGATTKDFDPSEISAVSGETGQWPGSRGYGVNIKFGF
jgi:hypothetical protein